MVLLYCFVAWVVIGVAILMFVDWRMDKHGRRIEHLFVESVILVIIWPGIFGAYLRGLYDVWRESKEGSL